MKAIAIAFSTYSKIPMPHFKWDEKSLQYSMCAFPLVGVVIGACEFFAWYLLSFVCSCSQTATAAILTALPVLMTGGIHMDGFLDTVDAKSSFKPMQEKLEILKDPHTGAFAIIRGCMYFLLYFGCMAEMVCVLSSCDKADSMRYMAVFAIGFCLERTLSGLSVLTFRKAKKEGMVAETARLVNRRSKGIMIIWLLVCFAAGCVIQPVYGILLSATALLVFLYYRTMSYHVFGGITGDLAGYFLQMCELWMLFGLCVFVHVTV